MKKQIYLVAILYSLFWLGSLCSQSLYDPNAIQEVYITFPFSNWDQKLDSLHAADSDARLIAGKVMLNGINYDSVGIRYKGNSTYNPNRLKNPLNIKLDFIKMKQNYQGYTTLKLSNGFMDPSFLREVMAYHITGQYLPSALSNFIKVYVNGSYNGLYTSVQAINDEFLNDHYYSVDGSFFQCDRPDKQVQIPNTCMPAMTGSTLRYGSADTACYFNSYEIQSKYGWLDLLQLMSQLNSDPTKVESILDVDRALWMVALNNFYANFDSYTGSGHNYLVYQDANKRFNTIPWDFNEFYGSFTNSGAGNLTVQQMQELSPTFHLTNADRPLISKLLAVPAWKKRYLAHLWTILQDAENNKAYASFGKSLQALITQAVSEDKNKFFTDASFLTNLDNDFTNAGAGGKTYPGLISFTNARINYLKNTADYKLVAPNISEEKFTPAKPTHNSSVFILAKIGNATIEQLFYRFDKKAIFKSVPMFDDGKHMDGIAGDGVYGAEIKIEQQNNLQYYYYAENANAAFLSPQRAEYEFHELTIIPEVILENEIRLNEFMASNVSFVQDQNGEFDDWIELANTTNSLLKVQGLFLSDNLANILKWQIPDTSVAADGYLVIWADENGMQTGPHANFKLSKSGETIYLSRFDMKILDSIKYSSQMDDHSFQLCNNAWSETNKPSFGKQNNCNLSLIHEPYLNGGSLLFENPFSEKLHISFLEKPLTKHEIQIHSMNGQLMYKQQIQNQKEANIQTDQWPAGIYILTDTSDKGNINIKLIKKQ